MALLPSSARAPALAVLVVAAALAPAVSVPAAGQPATAAPLELIITPDAFQQTLLPLKAWRDGQGLRTDLITISYLIGYQASVGARDLADAIHHYVASRKASDPGLEYLLLIGDDPVVPTRTLQVANRTASPSLPVDQRSFMSDFFYGVTATDFLTLRDLGDEYPGGEAWYGISDDEWSLTAQVHVGRIPVNTQAELAAYVDRLVAWESSPEPGTWSERALFALPLASPPASWGPDDRLYYDAAVAFSPALAGAAARGVTSHRLADYPQWPSPYSGGADNLSEVQLVSQWDGGASLVVIGGRDNALAGGPGTEYAGDGASAVFLPVARPAALDALSNGAKLPVAVAAFGYSANFSLANDSSFERALLAPSGGAAVAFGFTGPTALAGGPGGRYGGWTLSSLLVEELMSGGGTVGQAMDAARARMVASGMSDLGPAFDANDTQLRASIAGLTLLGDPASHVWAGSTPSLALAGPEAVAPHARTNVIFTVTAGGNPVEGATVAVLDEVGVLRSWARTGPPGTATFEVATEGPDVVWTVTASAGGYRRANASLVVDSPATVAIVNPGPGENVGGAYAFSGLAGDPDENDTVARVDIAFDAGPWVQAGGSTSWSFVVDTLTLGNGPHTVSARAFDGKAWGPAVSVAFNVTNPIPPALRLPYATIVVPEDNETTFDLVLDTHFTPTGPGGTFDATLGEAEFVRATLNGTVVHIDPAPNFFGTTALPVTVTESYGGNTSFNLTISVVAASDPPVLTVGGNQSVREGGVITFDPRAFDLDGTTPDVFLESGPPGATVTGWEAPRRSAGSYTFVFAATDGLYITRVSLVVTVVPYNEPPQAAIGTPAGGEAGRELAFEALGLVDRDGDNVSVEWQFGDGQRATTATTTHI
jgi:hypothetical protein